MSLMPQRLNLAIARRCDVACAGCYTFFGRSEPDLASFLSTVSVFVRLGLSHVTLSGGDPLTVAGLMDFLSDLRRVGVRSVKLDTVGVGLVSSQRRPEIDLGDLVELADYVGIPLDGWSNDGVLQFRRGRGALHAETIALLDAIDKLGGPPKIIINTVAHGGNLKHLDRLRDELIRHSCICHWNIFQYTPTDQAGDRANVRYSVDDGTFEDCRVRFFDRILATGCCRISFPIEFRSNRSRLGQYLLVNSDGEAWLPDEAGRTLHLGPISAVNRKFLRGGAKRSPLCSHVFPVFRSTPWDRRFQNSDAIYQLCAGGQSGRRQAH